MSHVEFHVKKWGDDEKTWPMQLQSECKCCQRIDGRIRLARKRGHDGPYKPRKPRMTPEQARAAKLRRYYNETPQQRRKRQKRQREDARMKRRLAGVPQRGAGTWERYAHERDGGTGQMRVPKGPFLEWFDEYVAVTGTDVDGLMLRIEDILGMGSQDAAKRAFYRIRYEQQNVSLFFVDAVAIAVGMPHIVNLLYPA